MSRVRRPSAGPWYGVALVVLVAVVITLSATWGRVLSAAGLRTANAPATIAPSIFAPTQTPSAAPQEVSGEGVIGAAKALPTASNLDPTMLAAAIGEVSTDDLTTTSGVVLDAATGSVLYDSQGSTLMIPASNTKVFTGLAVLSALGPNHRFTTSVVTNGASSLVLVGGGDPFLLSEPSDQYPDFASTSELAEQAAAALKAKGLTSVSLGYDDSLFTGESWNSTWPAGYISEVTPVSALWVNEGMANSSVHSTTPAGDAVKIFAAQLRDQGITVTALTGAASVPTSAPTLASVQSAPLSRLVEVALLRSDDSATEVLFRQFALASGEAASFAGGGAAMKAFLTAHGLWQSGAAILDGSGLSRSNRVSALMLAKAWHLAASQDTTRSLLTGLPVSGVSGTLATRFTSEDAEDGRGYVHAKTGTLTHVSTLSGWVVTQQGTVAEFAFMVNNSDDGNDWIARQWLDQVSTAVAGCGCSP